MSEKKEFRLEKQEVPKDKCKNCWGRGMVTITKSVKEGKEFRMKRVEEKCACVKKRWVKVYGREAVPEV